MHRHTGASTSAEASAWSAQSCPSFSVPSAQSRWQPHTLSPPTCDRISGVRGWRELSGSHRLTWRKLLRAPSPTSHILAIKHHSQRGQQRPPPQKPRPRSNPNGHPSATPQVSRALGPEAKSPLQSESTRKSPHL